jgi:hypothetical protein
VLIARARGALALPVVLAFIQECTEYCHETKPRNEEDEADFGGDTAQGSDHVDVFSAGGEVDWGAVGSHAPGELAILGNSS